MLAKIWKKALLAVCILACLYNVMSKLVSRTSLEIQLKSVENQTSLFDMFKEKNTKQEETNTQQEKENLETNVVETNQTNNEQEEDNTIVVIN